MKIKIIDKEITILEKINLVSKNVNTYKMDIELDEEFKKCTNLYVVYKNENVIKKEIIGPDMKSNIPHEVLNKEGFLYVGFFGTYLDGEVLKERHVTNLDKLKIVEGGYFEEATETEEINVTILEKYISEMNLLYRNYLEELTRISTDVSNMKNSVETSEQNAKASENNAKASETSAQNSANKASESETNVVNIEKNINATKEQIDIIKTNIDGQVNTVNTLAENAATQATKSEEQAKISAENAAATSADKNAVSEMKNEVEDFKTEAKNSRDEAESFKNETLQAKEVVENSLENERIESEKRYAKAVDTEVITVDEFAQIELDEDGYMEDVVVEASKEITQETREGYNKLPITYDSGRISTHGITATYNKNTGLFKIVGTPTEATWVNIFPILKSGTGTGDAGESIDVNGKYLISNYNKWDSANKLAVMFTDDTNTITQLNNAGMNYVEFNTETINRGWIYIPLSTTELNEEFWLMITDNYENKPYEAYGVSPSLNYPSEFKNVVKEVNIQNNEYTSKISLPEGQFLGNFQGYKNAIKNSVAKGQLKEIVFTGSEEGWNYHEGENKFMLGMKTDIKDISIPQLCTHYKSYSEWASSEKEFSFSSNNVRFHNDNNLTLDEWKVYLAEQYANGTPLKILYVALEEEKQELSQENLQVVNSLQTYKGENNISAPEAKLSFKANKSIPSYVKEEIDKKIAQNNLSEREISDNKYPRASKKKVSETDFVQVHAENEKIEGLKIYGEELTQETREGYNKFINLFVSEEKNGIALTVDEDKLHFEGELTANTSFRRAANIPAELLGKTVTLTIFGLENTNFINGGYKNITSGNNVLVVTPSNNSITVTVTQEMIDNANIFDFFATTTNFTTINQDIYIQICEGEKKPYEPYGVMPSFEYPSEVQVVSEQNVQVANENLISDTDNLYKIIGNGSVTINVNEKGAIILNGTPTANYIQLKNGINITDLLEDGETYTLFKTKSDSNVYNQINVSKKDGTGTVYISNYDNIKTFVVDKTTFSRYIYGIQLGGEVANKVTFNNYECNFMLLKGDYTNKEIKYIPYESTSSKISLPQDTFNGAIGDYKDTIEDVDGRWKIAKRIKKIVLNGSESWNTFVAQNNGNGRAVLEISDQIKSTQPVISDKLIYISWSNAPWSIAIDCISKFENSRQIYVYLKNISTLEDFKNKLSQNPVTIYYILATPDYIDLPDETQKILNGIKLRLGLNNFSIDVGTFSMIYNKSLAKELEEKDELIEDMAKRILALENATLNLLGGE